MPGRRWSRAAARWWARWRSALPTPPWSEGHRQAPACQRRWESLGSSRGPVESQSCSCSAPSADSPSASELTVRQAVRRPRKGRFSGSTLGRQEHCCAPLASNKGAGAGSAAKAPAPRARELTRPLQINLVVSANGPKAQAVAGSGFGRQTAGAMRGNPLELCVLGVHAAARTGAWQPGGRLHLQGPTQLCC